MGCKRYTPYVSLLKGSHIFHDKNQLIGPKITQNSMLESGIYYYTFLSIKIFILNKRMEVSLLVPFLCDFSSKRKR